MKKLLILTDFFPPYNNANGICSKRYADAFVEKGYEVHILCFRHSGERLEEVKNNLCIHRFKPRLFFRLREYAHRHTNYLGQLVYFLAIFMHRILGVLHIWEFPIESNLSAYRLYKRARNIARKNHIKNIIPSFMPAESLVAAYKLRRDGFNIVSIFWDTCSFTDNANRYSFIKKTGMRLEKKVFLASRKVCHLHSNYKHYLEGEFKEFEGKFIEIDIPFPSENIMHKQAFPDEERINLMYMGGLSRSNISFDKWIRVLGHLGDEYRVNFFSRGDAEAILQTESDSKASTIKRYGQVALEKLQEAQACADGFVTLGSDSENNKNIPSKIFECMSSGRIWIHFFKYEGDPSLEYVCRYPLGLAVNMEGCEDKIVREVDTFVRANLRKKVSRQTLEELFPMSSALRIAEILDKEFE